MEYIDRYDNLLVKYNSLLQGYFFGYLSSEEYLKYLDEIKDEFNDLKDEMIICNSKELNIYVDKIKQLLSSIPKSSSDFEIIMKLVEYDFISDICIDIDNIFDKKILEYINIVVSRKEVYSKLDFNFNNEEIINKMNNEISIKERYIKSKYVDLCIYTGGLLYSIIHIISTSYNDIDIKHPLVASIIPCLFFLLSILELSKIVESKDIIKECNNKIKKLI